MESSTSESKKPEVLALIPARAGSKGVVGKNTRLLHGLPLIGYAIGAALESGCVTRTVVTTDSEEIAEVGRALGAEAPFLRPGDLADDAAPMVETVRHALDWLEKEEGYVPEYVVLLQPTAPLRTAVHVDEAMGKLIASKADAIVSVVEVDTHWNAHWQLAFDGEEMRLADGKKLSEIVRRRQDLEKTYTRNGAIYGFGIEGFDRTGSFYGETCLGYLMEAHESVNIDTEADWVCAERALGGEGKK